MRTLLAILFFLNLIACRDSNEISTQCRECESLNFIDSVSFERFQIYRQSDQVLTIRLLESTETYRICNEEERDIRAAYCKLINCNTPGAILDYTIYKNFSDS